MYVCTALSEFELQIYMYTAGIQSIPTICSNPRSNGRTSWFCFGPTDHGSVSGPLIVPFLVAFFLSVLQFCGIFLSWVSELKGYKGKIEKSFVIKEHFEVRCYILSI